MGKKLFDNFDKITIENVTIKNGYNLPIAKLRIYLMFFMCVYTLGFPTDYGELVQKLCGFTAPAFFIISGFLVFGRNEEKPGSILRTVKRAAIVFGILTVVYFITNLIFYSAYANVLSLLKMPQFWFEFLLLNNWPFTIGSELWYVQALLYAYIILYFLDRFKLLRKDWVSGIIIAVCMAVNLLTGEFSGIIDFNMYGHLYLTGNFLTYALPYILIGRLIFKNLESLKKIKFGICILLLFIGTALCILEMWGLSRINKIGYYGHLLGMAIMAFSVCMLAFRCDYANDTNADYYGITKWGTAFIYYAFQIVSLGVAFLFSNFGERIFVMASRYFSIITFGICFGIVVFAAYIKNRYILKDTRFIKTGAID